MILGYSIKRTGKYINEQYWENKEFSGMELYKLERIMTNYKIIKCTLKKCLTKVIFLTLI